MLVFAFSFIGHVANVPVHVEKRNKDIHENVVTIISKLSTKEKLDIYNIGIKDIEALPDVLKTGARDSIKFHIERPSFLYIGTAIMTPLYVKPDDRIIVENDTSGNIYFRNVRYPQRSAELNFFFTLNKYLKKIRRKNVVPEIKTEEKILDSIQNTQHLSHGFVQEARYWITYRSLKFSYLASLRSKGPAGNLKPFPQNDSCINLLPYRGALYNYIMLLMRKGNSGKFDFKFLDEIAKNNFTGDTKKCALFMFLNFKMNTGLTDS
jgi:hypothetical protein